MARLHTIANPAVAAQRQAEGGDGASAHPTGEQAPAGPGHQPSAAGGHAPPSDARAPVAGGSAHGGQAAAGGVAVARPVAQGDAPDDDNDYDVVTDLTVNAGATRGGKRTQSMAVACSAGGHGGSAADQSAAQQKPAKRARLLPVKSAPASWVSTVTGAAAGDPESPTDQAVIDAWKALGPEGQRAERDKAKANAKADAEVTKAKAKQAKHAARLLAKAAKQVALANSRKGAPARAAGYKVAFAKCPASWGAGQANREEAWEQLSVADQKAAVKAAAPTKPTKLRTKAPPSFAAAHASLDEAALATAWQELGPKGRKQWRYQHPVVGKSSDGRVASNVLRRSRDGAKVRKAKVPKVFSAAHAGQDTESVRAKWVDMSRQARFAWLSAQRVKLAADAQMQARNVTLPRPAGSDQLQPSAVANSRTSRVKYAALEKLPELQERYTEDQWNVLGGSDQRDLVSKEKRKQADSRPRLSVQKMWDRSQAKMQRKKEGSKLTWAIQKKRRGLRTTGILQRFGAPALTAVDSATSAYHALGTRSALWKSTADRQVTYTQGDVPVAAQAASLQFVFPPSQLLEPTHVGSGRPRAAAMRPVKPVMISCNMNESKKIKALKALASGLSDAELDAAGLARASVGAGAAASSRDAPHTSWQEYGTQDVRSAVVDNTKQRVRKNGMAKEAQRARHVFGNLASLANRMPPAGGRMMWGGSRASGNGGARP